MTESSQLEGRYQGVLPKVTKMGSIISHRINYNEVELKLKKYLALHLYHDMLMFHLLV